MPLGNCIMYLIQVLELLFFFYILINLLLAASGLSCSTQDLSLWHVASSSWWWAFSLAAAHWLSCPKAPRILVPDQVLNPRLLYRRQILNHWTTREVLRVTSVRMVLMPSRAYNIQELKPISHSSEMIILSFITHLTHHSFPEWFWPAFKNQSHFHKI